MSTISKSYSTPFDASSLPFDASKFYYLEVPADSKKVYSLLLKHIASHLVDDDGKKGNTSFSASQSFQYEGIRKAKNQSSCVTCVDEDAVAKKKSSLKIGLGLFPFYSTPSKEDESVSKMYALHQAVGDPVGSDCGAQIYKSLVIFHEYSEQSIAEFITTLIDKSEATEAGYFTYFKWHIRYEYWQNAGRCKARSIDSVILPKATIDSIVSDVDNFLAPVTQNFYDKHGIPYRRSYLFHGLPGTGKTSLIQALAGHYKRSVCYLQPTNPDMTDDSLKDAISDLPDDAILVFEDIDSLFAKDRSSKVAKSALTFSGLLNALDGVGSSNGQIVVMTTNLRDQLDSALIRNGRVDIHVEFTHATDEQIEMMWNSYYPENNEKSADFLRALRASLGEKQVSASALQHFFVRTMMQSADQALSNVGYVLEDMKQKEVESKEGDNSKDVSTDHEDDKPEKNSTSENNWCHNINPLLLGSLVFLAAYAFLKKPK